MNRIWMLALLGVCTAVFAAGSEVYRWVDSSGTVHYTDKPPNPGAQPAHLPALQTYRHGSKSDPFTGAAASAPAKPSAAAVLALASPQADETLRDENGSVPLSVSYDLQPGEGVVFMIDGQPQTPQPVSDTSYTATGVERGAHSASARVVDSQGTEVAATGAVTFYMMPPRVNMSKPRRAPPPPKTH